mgnify:CR=1 FL=1
MLPERNVVNGTRVAMSNFTITRFAVGVGPSFSTGFHSDRPLWDAIMSLGVGLAPWAMTDLVS